MSKYQEHYKDSCPGCGRSNIAIVSTEIAGGVEVLQLSRHLLPTVLGADGFCVSSLTPAPTSEAHKAFRWPKA